MKLEGWQEVVLGEITDSYDSRRVPVKESDRRKGPYPYFGATGVIDWVDSYVLEGEYLLVAEDGENLRTRKEPIAYLTRDRFWVNNHAHVLRGNSHADTRFLKYALSALDLTGYLTGSTMPKLTQGNLSRITLRLPPLVEQRTISHVLGSLDDKIELNRRMNQTLEEICRALFKFWFVDFGPVRAKAEGRWKKGKSLPGMPADMWDLWPSEFEESEIGEIPKGWEVKPISSILEVNPPRQLVRGQVAPYVEMGQLSTSGARVVGWVPRPFTSGSRFRNGDTLVARITPCLENGKTGYVDFLADGEVGWGSTEFLVLGPRLPLPPQWVYLLARTESFRAHLIQNMSGTSGRQRAPADSLRSFLVASSPSPGVAKAFGSLVSPLFEPLKQNDSESATLAALRDSLLPKLLSGEIRLKVGT